MNKLNIQKTSFYNKDTRPKFEGAYGNPISKESLDTLLGGIKTICISDVDGTYINTNGAVRGAQAMALAKIANTSYEEAYANLEEHGLKGAVEQYMSLNDFFTGPYKTFDPFEAVKSGQMSVFEDALRFTRSGVPTIAISNSSEQATKNKLKALGIDDEFVGIHAAFLKNEAKPNIYLAEKAIKELDDMGWYNTNQQIIHVGDQEYDLQFGHNIKQIHPNAVSVLITRPGNSYKGNTKADYVISSFDDLNTL
ncbi:HAD family hydrolase [Candidatus Woesearchaeota archaeon]|nr:HAD family hydrolase [Candidatus Woesearchaeota archaeon]